MALYNDTSAKFNNANLNSVGSEYASLYGHDVSLLVQKLTNRAIFDAAPQQFMDLKLLNMVGPEQVNSDEFFYQEMGYQREPLVATAAASAVSFPTTQTISVASVENISTNTIISYPNGQKGNVVFVDGSVLTITVAPYNGDTLPAVAADDILANVSTVDHDGSEGFAQYFRASTIERNNYVQLFNKAIRYSEVELHKLKNMGTTSNFLEMERNAMFNQHRIDISNAFWVGQKGEIATQNGTVAKTTGGVFSSMLEAGSPNALATSSTLVDAFEDMVLSSEYGDYGQARMAFMTPRMHRMLSLAYKEELTRYQPNDEVALLNLKEINLGSSRIVLVPYKRFEDTASFGNAFTNRIAILDMKNIKRTQLWGERSGDTLKLEDGVPKRFGDVWVDCNMGVKFHNPLACAYLDVQ
jgi:prepilin-type processing-associated H-X9-DG protein